MMQRDKIRLLGSPYANTLITGAQRPLQLPHFPSSALRDARQRGGGDLHVRNQEEGEPPNENPSCPYPRLGGRAPLRRPARPQVLAGGRPSRRHRTLPPAPEL